MERAWPHVRLSDSRGVRPPAEDPSIGYSAGDIGQMNAHDRVRDLEQQIGELKSRWPAHSVSPAMVQQLDELEEKLEAELNRWNSTRSRSTVSRDC